MAESQILSVIRVWAAVAWADGVLAESEAEGLRRLLRTAELTPDERTEASQVLEHEVPLPEAYLSSLTAEARRGIYRAACRMAIVDHEFADTERAVLAKLRVLLGVPDDVAAEIEANVPGLV
jgi:uncharacterized membrane protein YebE (DUF533 family)